MFMVSNGDGALRTDGYFSGDIFNSTFVSVEKISDLFKYNKLFNTSNNNMIFECNLTDFMTKVLPKNAPAIAFVNRDGFIVTPLGMIKYGLNPWYEVRKSAEGKWYVVGFKDDM